MKKIHRKMLRDLSASKWLFLAVGVVIFLGVALFGASFMGYQNLNTSYNYSYDTLGMADFTVKVSENAGAVTEELHGIEGIEHITGRINRDMALELPDGKRVGARIISLPANNRAEVNDVKVEEGDYLDPENSQALLVQKSFAEHHGLSPDDNVTLTAENQQIGFTVAGIVTSPEYIVAAKSRQELLVSPEIWGVVFVSGDAISGMVEEGFTNEYCFLFDDKQNATGVIAQIEEILAPYGIMEALTLEDQPSNAALQMDLQEFGEMAEVFPLLFLIMGAMATYILLTRVVHNQRPQIGLMRAIGYSRRQVLVHYLSFALMIGVLGSVVGTIVGFLLSSVVTHFYVGVIGLPYTRIEPQWMAIEEGLFLGIFPCLIAGILPALAASRLSPAEAMRTPPPAVGRKLLLERMFPFLTQLSSVWKIPLRNIFRNQRRSLYTIIGVVFGVSLILVSAGMIDSVEDFLKLQFNDIQKYDAQVIFTGNQDRVDQLAEVDSWEGVEGTEPILQIPTRLLFEEESYSTMMIGLSPESELYRVYATSGEQTRVSDQGVLLSKGLQKTLGIEVGDIIIVQSAYGDLQLEVLEFVKQTMGGFVYTSLDQSQLLVGGDVISGVMIQGDVQQMDAVRSTAYEIDSTASVELTSETKAELDKMMGLIKYIMGVMLLFGAVLAVAIVFTTVTVNILERRREIGTMRTLGESKGRIAAMITIENLALGLMGLLPGILLGYVLALQMFSLFQSDMMTFGLVIYTRTYILTAVLVIIILLVSQLPGIYQAGRLDLAQVVKEQAN